MTQTLFDNGNAIEAHGLVKTYPGDVRALDGLDLTVAAAGRGSCDGAAVSAARRRLA